jgi:sugar-specific transcriptional regulator TrmB
MGSSNDKNIETYLGEFGLSREEITIYVELLRSGKSSILDISKKTGIKRSTAHNYVESLIEKGIVSQTSFGGRRLVVAEVPEKLEVLLNQEKWRLKRIEADLPDMVKVLYNLVPNARENTTASIKYYEGEKGFREVCQRSLDLAKEEICFISNLDEWYKVYTKEYDKDHYIPERLKRGQKLRMLVLQSDLTKSIRGDDQKLMRQTRYLVSDKHFSSTMIIYQDEISIMLSNEPYTAIVISNPSIYGMFRLLFDNLWSSAGICT